MAVNGTVPWGAVNVPFDVFDAALKAGQKYAIDPAVLLAIGRFESNYRTDATNINPPTEASYGWLQFNRLAGNGSRQQDPTFDIDKLFDPYHSANLAAKNIRGSLDRGATLYDAVSPWSVRDKAFEFLNTQPGILATQIPNLPPVNAPAASGAASSGSTTVNTTGASPNFAFPKLALASLGPWTLDVDSAPLFKVALSVGAVVLLFVGVIKLTSLDSAAKKVV